MNAQQTADGAYAGFVTASYAALVRTGYLLTGDRNLAEDLVQQCLLTTYRAWSRLDDPGSAEAYTRTSMVRLATRWRQRHWRAEVPTEQIPEPSAGNRAAGDHAAGIATADVVRRALARLPAAQRAVLVLRFFDDRSEQEVATMLRCSVGTVKSRTSRALSALRDQGLIHDEIPIGAGQLSTGQPSTGQSRTDQSSMKETQR